MEKREMKTYEKRAKYLLVIWIVSYILFNIGSTFYVSCQRVFAQNDPTAVVGGFHFFTFGLFVLYFIPLLAVTRYFLKRSDSKKLYIIVTAVLIWLIISTVFLLAYIFLAYVFPDLIAEITSLIQ